MKSIIPQDKDCCYFCIRLDNNYREYRKGELHEHHIFYGTANRKNSEKYGMKVWLCPRHHTGSDGVHSHKVYDEYLKRYAQNLFEQNHSREEFISIFGKSWL